MHVEEVEEPETEGRDGPAGPDCPAVAAGAGDEGTDYKGTRGHGEGFGEEGHAGEDGRETLHCFVVERQVVEGADDNHAVNDDADVRGGCVAVLENAGPNNWVRGYVFFVHVCDD